MIRTRASQSPLGTLAALWQMLALSAVALSRQLLEMERAGDHRTYLKAQALEAWVCGALGLLTKQIGEHEDAPSDTGDTAAGQYLGVAFSMLTILLYFARALMQRVKGLGAQAPSGNLTHATLFERIWPRPQSHTYNDSS